MDAFLNMFSSLGDSVEKWVKDVSVSDVLSLGAQGIAQTDKAHAAGFQKKQELSRVGGSARDTATATRAGQSQAPEGVSAAGTVEALWKARLSAYISAADDTSVKPSSDFKVSLNEIKKSIG